MMDTRRRQAPRSSAQQPQRFNIGVSSPTNTASLSIPSTPSSLSSELGSAAITSFLQTEQKVAIPRLQRPGLKHSTSGPDRQRVSHACDECRRRKSKCDGLQPCSRCSDQDISCFYGDGKREKLKRKAQKAAKVKKYESLLVELLPTQDDSIQQDIINALSESRTEEDSVSGDEPNDDEHSVPATVAFPQFKDCIQQSTARDVGTAGYLGKSSVVHWIEETMAKLVNYTHVSKDHDLTPGVPGMHNEVNMDNVESLIMEDCNYFSSEITVPQLSGIPQSINAAFQIPPKSTGEMLINSYFLTVHPFLPVVNQKEFTFQYQSYCKATQPPNGSYLWVAILNVVFAIGALYIEYAQIPCECAERHLIYWMRSRLLGQEPIQMIGVPTIEHIQLLTVSGVYCIASYQINRACYLIALAVRYAYSRALHLANADPDMTENQRELQVNVWHSLCSVERLLSMLTGLPPSIQDQFISARLPRATDHFISSSAGHYDVFGSAETVPMPGSRKGSPSCHQNTFIASLRLDSIVHDVLAALYSSGTENRTWARVQQTVLDLDRRLTHWQNDLPPGLLLSPKHDDMVRFPMNERVYLSFRFLGTRMLINRPSLCDIYELNVAIPSQSKASQRLDADAAVRCISAARCLVKLLPARFDSVEFYRSAPWWCALHYLIQAGVVLVTEVSLEMQHMPAEAESIIAESALVVRWLQTLSATNDAAHRAYFSLDRLLKLALGKLRKQQHGNNSFPPDTPIPQAPPPHGLSFHAQNPNLLSGTNWGPAYR